MTSPDPPLACDLSALTAAERSRRDELVRHLRARSLGLSETERGFAVALPDEPEACRDSFELLLLERRCCPFLDLGLHLERAGGPVRLLIEGGAGVKEFLRGTDLWCGGGGCDG